MEVHIGNALTMKMRTLMAWKYERINKQKQKSMSSNKQKDNMSPLTNKNYNKGQIF